MHRESEGNVLYV